MFLNLGQASVHPMLTRTPRKGTIGTPRHPKCILSPGDHKLTLPELQFSPTYTNYKSLLQPCGPISSPVSPLPLTT